jgi:hypothetical protein
MCISCCALCICTYWCLISTSLFCESWWYNICLCWVSQLNYVKKTVAFTHRIKHLKECLFLILMGIAHNQGNLPFHMPIVCSLFARAPECNKLNPDCLFCNWTWLPSCLNAGTRYVRFAKAESPKNVLTRRKETFWVPSYSCIAPHALIMNRGRPTNI